LRKNKTEKIEKKLAVKRRKAGKKKGTQEMFEKARVSTGKGGAVGRKKGGKSFSRTL